MAKNTLRAILFATSATVFSVPAYAQEDTSGANAQIPVSEAADIPEIAVTAQRRNQRLQDVPVAVSIASGETLIAGPKISSGRH